MLLRCLLLAVIDKVIDVVKLFASGSSDLVIKDGTLDVLERVRFCLQVNGGYFQHLNPTSTSLSLKKNQSF